SATTSGGPYGAAKSNTRARFLIDRERINIMGSWTDELALAEHYNDLLREARQHDLSVEARRAMSSRPQFYDRALAVVGRQLATWGTRLKTQYGAIAETTPAAGETLAPS
ncbi:MAG TPA: hypothetical protein VER55_03390, partial [Ardenticatenaceae bacterium]|nr:hypothetical protein [Ardenticatenaceae bacterium]